MTVTSPDNAAAPIINDNIAAALERHPSTSNELQLLPKSSDEFNEAT